TAGQWSARCLSGRTVPPSSPSVPVSCVPAPGVCSGRCPAIGATPVVLRIASPCRVLTESSAPRRRSGDRRRTALRGSRSGSLARAAPSSWRECSSPLLRLRAAQTARSADTVFLSWHPLLPRNLPVPTLLYGRGWPASVRPPMHPACPCPTAASLSADSVQYQLSKPASLPESRRR